MQAEGSLRAVVAGNQRSLPIYVTVMHWLSILNSFRVPSFFLVCTKSHVAKCCVQKDSTVSEPCFSRISKSHRFSVMNV